jgi:beta-phosphoglucomutase-like phosphatase (HAD superfamily)
MSLPRLVKAVVFDMGGLLVDTEAVVFRAMARAAEGQGGELPLEVFRRMVGLTNTASDAIVAGHFGAGFDLAAQRPGGS